MSTVFRNMKVNTWWKQPQDLRAAVRTKRLEGFELGIADSVTHVTELRDF